MLIFLSEYYSDPSSDVIQNTNQVIKFEIPLTHLIKEKVANCNEKDRDAIKSGLTNFVSTQDWQHSF